MADVEFDKYYTFVTNFNFYLSWSSLINKYAYLDTDLKDLWFLDAGGTGSKHANILNGDTVYIVLNIASVDNYLMGASAGNYITYENDNSGDWKQWQLTTSDVPMGKPIQIENTITVTNQRCRRQQRAQSISGRAGLPHARCAQLAVRNHLENLPGVGDLD